MKLGDIKGQTGSRTVAAQDQDLSANCLKKKKTILKEEIESERQLCTEYEDTTDHLTSGCPILTKNENIIRHDKVCTYLNYSIHKKSDIETPQNSYSHISKAVCEHEDITVLWNEGVQTDREVLANRTDIITTRAV
jgi:hypothetical protein